MAAWFADRDREVMKEPRRLPQKIHLLVYFRSLSVVCFPVGITTEQSNRFDVFRSVTSSHAQN